MDAYILINTKPGKVWQIAEAILNISGIKMAHVVTGQYDIIAFVQFDDVGSLKKILSKIQNIGGITRTQTAVSMAVKKRTA